MNRFVALLGRALRSLWPYIVSVVKWIGKTLLSCVGFLVKMFAKSPMLWTGILSGLGGALAFYLGLPHVGAALVATSTILLITHFDGWKGAVEEVREWPWVATGIILTAIDALLALHGSWGWFLMVSAVIGAIVFVGIFGVDRTKKWGKDSVKWSGKQVWRFITGQTVFGFVGPGILALLLLFSFFLPGLLSNNRPSEVWAFMANIFYLVLFLGVGILVLTSGSRKK